MRPASRRGLLSVVLVLRWAALCAELASTHSLDPLAVWAEHTAAQTPASDAPNPTGLGGWRYYFRPEDEAAIYPARLLGLEEGETVTVMGTPALKIEVEGGVSIPPQPSAAARGIGVAGCMGGTLPAAKMGCSQPLASAGRGVAAGLLGLAGEAYRGPAQCHRTLPHAAVLLAHCLIRGAGCRLVR